MMLFEEEIQIDGKVYKLGHMIGEGAAGAVYEGTCDGTNFAIKVIRNYQKNQLLRNMVDQEIKTQMLFQKENNIIKCHSSKVLNKKMFIVFERGEYSLRNKIEAWGIPTEKEYLSMMQDVTKGLNSVHSKDIIHRDIKPQNIIFAKGTYKITDFGTSVKSTQGADMIGTPLYFAPEMLFEIQKQYTQKVDVWSLGVMAFEAYFGIHPFFYRQSQSNKTELAMGNDVYDELKQNIKALTPEFTLKKFVKHLQSKSLYDKAQSVQNKVKVTNEALGELFSQFFELKESERPQISVMVALLDSLQEMVENKKPRESRVLKEPPSDLKFFIDTKNIFYKLSSEYGFKKDESVEFHLELGLWYLNYANYNGEKYVEYEQLLKLEQYKKERRVLWEEVRTALFEYWLWLSTNIDLKFFEELPVFKLRILLCGAWNRIITDLTNFCKKISEKGSYEINSLQELPELIFCLDGNFSSIEKISSFLVDSYYK